MKRNDASKMPFYPRYSESAPWCPCEASNHTSKGKASRLGRAPAVGPAYCKRRWREHAMKRALDVTFSLQLLILLAPMLLLIILAIKATSSGPAIFRQQRYGLNGRMFEIYKFRTMYVAACDPSGVKQVTPHDKRVTPVGNFLRKSSLDELPQILNVLRGDMSLVGPRPHVPGMLGGGILYETLVPEYFERLRVLPGVTGLAQVNGLRGGTDDPIAARARITKDLEYIQRWSFSFDIWIIVKTVQRELFRGHGF